MVDDLRYPGTVKLEVCKRLVDDWPLLADALDVPLDARRGFERGRGPAGVWEWLEQRLRLDQLAPALLSIGRPDLAELLARADVGRAGVEHWEDATRQFTGRAAAIEEIAAWTTAAERPPVCFVTGDPGSGKSAVLGWFAVGPDARRAMPDASTRPHLPDGVVLAAVDAEDKKLSDVVAAIRSSAATGAELRASLQQGPPGIVVIDAIDEADDPADLLGHLVEPFALGDGQPVGLLVAGRIQVVPRGYDPSRVKVVDLDAYPFADADGVVQYAFRFLADPGRPGTARYRDSPIRARRIAAAIAADAASSFLVAQLTCMALIEGKDFPDDGRHFPSRIGDAMNLYLSALPDRRSAEDLLRPLALARGDGLPRPLWANLAGQLAGTPGRYSGIDIAALQGSSVQALFRSSRAGGRTGYRLFHEALGEHLRALTPSDPEAPAPGPEMAAAFARALLDAVPVGQDGRRDWRASDAYALAHLAQHAAGTPVLGELLGDAGFLVHAHPGGVLRALPHADPADRAAVIAYESVALRLGAEKPPAERAAQLALGAHCSTDPDPVRRWDVDGSLRDPAATWWPRAARWQTVRSRVVHRHDGAVAAIRFARVLGTTMVLSGSEDGTVGLAVLPNLWTGSAVGADDRAIPLGRPVRALGVAMVDRRPLVVAGTGDGNLHLVDLPGGAVLDRSARAGGSGVSAVAARPGADADGVVVGYEDGTVQGWRLFPLEPLSPGVGTDGSEVAVIVSTERSGNFAATGAGGIWRWGSDGPARLVPLSVPRVTAMVDGDPGAPGGFLATGHDDGSVRLWVIGPVDLREAFLSRVPSVVLAMDAIRLDGRHLLVVSHEDGDVVVLEVPSGRTWPHGLGGHAAPLWDLAAVTVGRAGSVAAGGEDDEVRLWPLDEAEHVDPWTDAPMPTRLAEVGGRLLGVAVDGSGGSVVLDGMYGTPIDGPHAPPSGQSLSTNHIVAVEATAWWAVGTDGGEFAAGPVGSAPRWQPAAAQDWVIGVAVLRTCAGVVVVAVTVDGSACIVGADDAPETGTDLRLDGLEGVTAIAVHSETGVLAAADRTGRLGCWSLRTRRPVVEPFAAAAASIDAVAWRSSELVVGSRDGRVTVVVGSRTVDIGQHRRVSRIAPLPHGILTGGADGTLRLRPDARPGPGLIIDLGAPITDVLPLSDGSVAVATGRGAILLDIPAP